MRHGWCGDSVLSASGPSSNGRYRYRDSLGPPVLRSRKAVAKACHRLARCHGKLNRETRTDGIIVEPSRSPGRQQLRYAMRKFAMAAVMSLLLGGATESQASEGPWCHTFGGAQGSIENCRLSTFEMCRAEIQGNCGSCSPNPRWHADRPERPAPRRHG
jgi:Protein of unknown function (DUF3551)